MTSHLRFDENADAQVLPLALEAYAEASVLYGNPSSAHAQGRAAASLLHTARAEIAEVLGANDDEIIFTSGGTEANALALNGFLQPGRRNHVVTTTIEHASVRNNLQQLAAKNLLEIHFVQVGRTGRVRVEDVLEKIRPDTALVSVVMACNETGVMQPVHEIAAQLAKTSTIVHSDGIQAVGRTSIHFKNLQLGALSFAAHKLGGVAGVGALVVQRGLPIQTILEGGGQELGRRSGTENLPGVFALSRALQARLTDREQHTMAQLRDVFEKQLVDNLPDIEIVGGTEPRLWNTSCVRFVGCAGDALMMALDLEGVAVSTGSACSSGSVSASPILLGMGLSKKEAQQTVRFSIGRFTQALHCERVAELVITKVKKMRDMGARV